MSDYGATGLYLLIVDAPNRGTGVTFVRRRREAALDGPNPLLYFRLIHDYNGELTVLLPTWVLVVVSIALATVAWWPGPKLRFSLRTLLITTALVAVALGLVALSGR